MTKEGTKNRLEAFNAIVARLTEFDTESQQHILQSVRHWLGIDNDVATPSTRPISIEQRISDEQAFPGFARESDQSPKQFLMEKAPRTNVERIACLAYFLTHYRHSPHFKTIDISKLNTEAAQPKFTNASVAVNDASIAGLLVASTKGAKQISAMGEQFVLALPDRESANAVLKRMKPKRRKKTVSKNKKRLG